MKEIQLTQNQVALVDDADYEEQNKHKWHAKWNKGTQSFYAARKEGWPLEKEVLMHREIMGTPKGMMCDHINHDTLFNCRENLRNVTNSQNQMNRKGAQSNNQLGERCIRRRGNGFEVRIKVDRKYVYDKMFSTLEAAITARDAAFKDFHGDFSS